jgi:carboxyl-terminal processing protease
VTLTVRYGDEEREYTMTRALFHVTVASGQMLTDGIGMVTIENFDDRCADETIAAIEELLAQGATKLIFDVRNNPGGYKTELCEVLDYLLPEGPLFRSEYYDGKVQVDESDANYLDVPMAVLVNAESISAAEFFAAALDEYDAATVVGEQTIGKGYFQQSYRLSDGSAVGLSVGRYTTPKGISLTDVGITPDVVVEVDDELFWQIYYGNVTWEEDPQILAAVEVLKNAE